MGFIGVERGFGIEVARLSRREDTVSVVASLERFWAAPRSYLDAPGEEVTLADVTRVPPVPASAKVMCIGLNYLAHVAEGSYSSDPLPEHPTLFARWASTLSVDGAAIPLPSNEVGLDWEGEIVAWVGETLIDATPEEALAAVIGYSTFNDVTSRRAQKLTSQWSLGKNGDASGPLGPMVPARDVGDLRDGLRISTRVNGVTMQDATTDQMVYHVGETLSLLSHTVTLRPGDLLATGTPSGVGYSRTPPVLLAPGDEVEVEVERLGVLRNSVVRRTR